MLLLSNGLVIDGSGRDPFLGSVLIDEDRIVAIGPKLEAPSAPVVDCSGLVISPGFIDLHSHSDLQVLEGREEKLRQGVTTEVVGNCGFSPFPYAGDAGILREFAGGILGRGGTWGWPSAAAYLGALAENGAATRAISLVGHGSMRVAVCGLRQGPPPDSELDRLSGLLEDALDAGCAGFSTGLMYAPGSSAGREELEPLCRVVARKGKLYATHMRSYSAGILDSVREQIELAEATGCRLQISHLQTAGRANWQLQDSALNEIEKARTRGIDIEFDIYPYQCGSTVLTQFLPQWSLDGGTEAMLNRLRNPDIRKKMIADMNSAGPRQWADVTISSVASSANASAVGKTVAELSEDRGQDGETVVFDLLIEECGAVNVISFNQSSENLRQLITHPLCSVITDGFYVAGKPHPRLYGTYPELLGGLVRDRAWLSLPAAVHKSTGKPAARLNLKDQGLLQTGYKADITIFDPAQITSRSTYESPAVEPKGIIAVIKDGRVVVDHAFPGTAHG
jgi:dihydroorotase/N-acyl-D-amino-acid deacylase